MERFNFAVQKRIADEPKPMFIFKMETKEKETIKDLYKDLLEIAEVNHPEYYMMPKTFYNNICKDLEKIQLYFRRKNQSIASWRIRAEKAEAELKELKK